MAKQPSKSRASKNGKAAKGKAAKGRTAKTVKPDLAPTKDESDESVVRVDPKKFDLHKVGVDCACSPCPESITTPLLEAGWHLGGKSCIEVVFAVLTKEALAGSEPHTKLLLDQLGGKSSGTNININQTSNTMNVNYADQDQEIAEEIARSLNFKPQG